MLMTMLYCLFVIVKVTRSVSLPHFFLLYPHLISLSLSFSFSLPTLNSPFLSFSFSLLLYCYLSHSCLPLFLLSALNCYAWQPVVPSILYNRILSWLYYVLHNVYLLGLIPLLWYSFQPRSILILHHNLGVKPSCLLLPRSLMTFVHVQSFMYPFNCFYTHILHVLLKIYLRYMHLL